MVKIIKRKFSNHVSKKICQKYPKWYNFDTIKAYVGIYEIGIVVASGMLIGQPL